MRNVRLVGKVVAWAAVGVVATAGVAGAATEMNHSSSTSSIATDAAASPTAASGSSAHQGRRGARARLRGLLGSSEYGSVTYQVKGKDVTLDAQRGAISAISATGFTVTSVDGHAQTYVVSAKTKVATSTGKAATGTAVTGFTSGEDVTVVAVQNGSTETAMIVRPARIKKTPSTSSTPSTPSTTTPSASSSL